MAGNFNSSSIHSGSRNEIFFVDGLRFGGMIRLALFQSTYSAASALDQNALSSSPELNSGIFFFMLVHTPVPLETGRSKVSKCSMRHLPGRYRLTEKTLYKNERACSVRKALDKLKTGLGKSSVLYYNWSTIRRYRSRIRLMTGSSSSG